ncbi:MAG TPA: RNA methyltransferase [Gaiellaceae bacterium]|jgi:TrmH family RNA methyltransferase|nr:RNA methyltransferase [Gaiellaceae bacterium]
MIRSRQNEKLKLVRKLAERRWREKLGLFVAEGEDLVEAARGAGIEPVELLVAGETVEPELLAEVSTLAHPPRVVGVYRRADLPAGPYAESGLAVWRVGDPGNVGTLIRAADALGPAYVALSSGCADPTGPKALRASAGAIFRVPMCGFDEAPRPWIALVPQGGDRLSEVAAKGSATFVLGAEREGIPDEVLARCEARATIPQRPSAESLNVAMAGTIALYELGRY